MCLIYRQQKSFRCSGNILVEIHGLSLRANCSTLPSIQRICKNVVKTLKSAIRPVNTETPLWMWNSRGPFSLALPRFHVCYNQYQSIETIWMPVVIASSWDQQKWCDSEGKNWDPIRVYFLINFGDFCAKILAKMMAMHAVDNCIKSILTFIAIPGTQCTNSKIFHPISGQNNYVSSIPDQSQKCKDPENWATKDKETTKSPLYSRCGECGGRKWISNMIVWLHWKIACTQRFG